LKNLGAAAARRMATPTHSAMASTPASSKNVVLHDLDGHEFESLADEITMLRVLIRQIFEDVVHAPDVADRMEGFCAVSLGCFSLSCLVRTPHIIAPEGSGHNSAFKEVIAMVKDELCSSLMPHYRFGGFNRIYLQGILPNAASVIAGKVICFDLFHFMNQFTNSESDSRKKRLLRSECSQWRIGFENF